MKYAKAGVFMNYGTLMELSISLAYRLAMCGAETYRIEESVNRIMSAYRVHAETFAIPNCIHVSIETDDGTCLTRMCRVGAHDNDLDSVEKYTAVSRRICAEIPDPEVALNWVRETDTQKRKYALPIYLLGNFLGGCGFSVVFGGSIPDSILGGLCGVIIGLVDRNLGKMKVNPFFRIIASAFFMALFAYACSAAKLTAHVDSVIIGALMILVPGLLFTNAMRDIIYGDTNSGINRVVQVFLIAVAIALGTAAAWASVNMLTPLPAAGAVLVHSLWLDILAAFVGCLGFVILFNIHGFGGILCALGGALTWLTFRLCQQLGSGDLPAYFFATVVASGYSEAMARIRKFPAISYLVISIFPLLPGAGIYYAMNYAIQGEMSLFANKFTETLSIAGIMAVGILIVSTSVRLSTEQLQKARQTQLEK